MSYWKVSVLDTDIGKFIIRHVCVRSFSVAKAMADWYARIGETARASRHDGKEYYYGRSL